METGIGRYQPWWCIVSHWLGWGCLGLCSDSTGKNSALLPAMLEGRKLRENSKGNTGMSLKEIVNGMALGTGIGLSVLVEGIGWAMLTGSGWSKVEDVGRNRRRWKRWTWKLLLSLCLPQECDWRRSHWACQKEQQRQRVVEEWWHQCWADSPRWLMMFMHRHCRVCTS